MQIRFCNSMRNGEGGKGATNDDVVARQAHDRQPVRWCASICKTVLTFCWLVGLVARKKETSRSQGDPIRDGWLVEWKVSGSKEG